MGLTLQSVRSSYLSTPHSLITMATGTIRRFLEHYGDTIDVVVFVADSNEVRVRISCSIQCQMPPLQMVYDKVLPVYFPRTKAEQEWATPIIPADIGLQHPFVAMEIDFDPRR